MSAFKAFLPVAAFAVGALGASCSTSGTLTVTNTADTASLSGCSTYSGSIAIATGATAITLDGPKRITGDVVALSGGTLTSLEASDLQIIDGALNITNLGALQSIVMPKLTEVTTFTISQTGQSLLSLGFGTPGLVQVTNFTIDDTYLQSLTGIDLTTAGSITVTNNQLIQTLTMSLVNTTGDINIRGNNNGLNVNLANLLSCAGLSVNDCTNVEMNSLQNATGLIAFNSNFFQTLSLPNLTTAAGGFTVEEDAMLTNLSIPLLKSAGSVNLANNTKLTGNISFPSLSLVNGAVAIDGGFSGVSMPKLSRVAGTFSIKSSADISSSCSTFNSDGSGVFAIAPVCSGLSSTTGSPTGSSGGSTTSSSAALHHYSTPEVGYGVFGVLAALMGMLM